MTPQQNQEPQGGPIHRDSPRLDQQAPPNPDELLNVEISRPNQISSQEMKKFPEIPAVASVALSLFDSLLTIARRQGSIFDRSVLQAEIGKLESTFGVTPDPSMPSLSIGQRIKTLRDEVIKDCRFSRIPLQHEIPESASQPEERWLQFLPQHQKERERVSQLILRMAEQYCRLRSGLCTEEGAKWHASEKVGEWSFCGWSRKPADAGGIWVHQDGTTIIGTQKNGVSDGFTVRLYTDGGFYCGWVRQGKKNGSGVLFDPAAPTMFGSHGPKYIQGSFHEGQMLHTEMVNLAGDKKFFHYAFHPYLHPGEMIVPRRLDKFLKEWNPFAPTPYLKDSGKEGVSFLHPLITCWDPYLPSLSRFRKFSHRHVLDMEALVDGVERRWLQSPESWPTNEDAKAIRRLWTLWLPDLRGHIFHELVHDHSVKRDTEWVAERVKRALKLDDTELREVLSLEKEALGLPRSVILNRIKDAVFDPEIFKSVRGLHPEAHQKLMLEPSYRRLLLASLRVQGELNPQQGPSAVEFDGSHFRFFRRSDVSPIEQLLLVLHDAMHYQIDSPIPFRAKLQTDSNQPGLAEETRLRHVAQSAHKMDYLHNRYGYLDKSLYDENYIASALGFSPEPVGSELSNDRQFELSAEGKLIPWDYEQYHFACIVGEIYARWVSDIYLVQELGIDYYEGQSGKPSLAGMFRELNVVGVDEQLELLFQLEFHGSTATVANILNESERGRHYAPVLDELIAAKDRERKFTEKTYKDWLAAADKRGVKWAESLYGLSATTDGYFARILQEGLKVLGVDPNLIGRKFLIKRTEEARESS